VLGDDHLRLFFRRQADSPVPQSEQGDVTLETLDRSLVQNDTELRCPRKEGVGRAGRHRRRFKSIW
jgi:hypothetical protein